jgi:hypothetical protein
MKKTYSTPDIMFESFALNENIANVNTNCTRNITNMYSGDCGLKWYDMFIFTTTAGGCQNKLPDGAYGICYHVPTGDNKVFNS